MEYIKKLLEISPFNYDRIKRNKIFYSALESSFRHHMRNCKTYKKWNTQNNIFQIRDVKSLENFPYLPNSIFKKVNLISSKNLYKQITSSGKSGQKKSKIHLDKNNAINQTIALSKILTALLGSKRKPFLIIDVDPTGSLVGTEVSARTAGMSGYIMASSEQKYLLENNHSLKIDYLDKIIKDYIKKKTRICNNWIHVFDISEIA